MLSSYWQLILRIYRIKKIRIIANFLLLFLLFNGISLFFYLPLWQQLIAKPNPQTLILQGEYPVYEFVAETVRENILSLSNPFQITDHVLYPFGWRYALDDVAPINGFYYLILRNFLSIHQSLVFIVLAGIAANGVCMFYMLRKLTIDRYSAIIVSLIFAFTPFVSLRLPAHPTYIALYLFPFSTYCFLQLITTNDNDIFKKYLWAIIFGVSLLLFVLTNLYYTVMFSIMCFLLLIFAYSPNLVKIIRQNITYFSVSLITSAILLLPWIIEVYGILLRRSLDKPKNLYDMTTFSADFINILLPSSLNPFYSAFVNKLGQQYTYIQSIFENFTYPGVLLLYGIIAFCILRRHLPKELQALMWSLISFFVLTLGPYLHIFGKNTHIPLPYLMIAYTPVLQMARSPGRFIVPFIFLASILLAFVLRHILRNKPALHRITFYIFITCVFLIDQNIKIHAPPTILLPINIYSYLSKQEATPILEIPFSIRDSIKNFGHYHTHWSSYAQLFHRHPIFGIYAGRVPNIIYAYYIANPLLGPMGQMVDINETDISSKLQTIQPEKLREALDIYNVEYSVLKMNEPFTKEFTALLPRYGFKQMQQDGLYTLWRRNTNRIEISRIMFDSTYPEILIGDGWSPPEQAEKGRWMMSKTSRVLLNTYDLKKKKISINAQSFAAPQAVEIYLNSRYMGVMKFNNERYTTESITLNQPLKKGLNVFTLYAPKTYKPSDYIAGSQDHRSLSLHVHSILLQ